MYFKVAIFATLALFLSGCATTPAPEPKKPDVKVVEEVENTPTEVKATVVENSTETVTTIEEAPVKESKKEPAQEKKYKLKPEPFSLGSDEEDPELLGPQTTLDRDLTSDDSESSSSDEKEESL